MGIMQISWKYFWMIIFSAVAHLSLRPISPTFTLVIYFISAIINCQKWENPAIHLLNIIIGRCVYQIVIMTIIQQHFCNNKTKPIHEAFFYWKIFLITVKNSWWISIIQRKIEITISFTFVYSRPDKFWTTVGHY
jgi:hypothetical protein